MLKFLTIIVDLSISSCSCIIFLFYVFWSIVIRYINIVRSSWWIHNIIAFISGDIVFSITHFVWYYYSHSNFLCQSLWILPYWVLDIFFSFYMILQVYSGVQLNYLETIWYFCLFVFQILLLSLFQLNQTRIFSTVNSASQIRQIPSWYFSQCPMNSEVFPIQLLKTRTISSLVWRLGILEYLLLIFLHDLGLFHHIYALMRT